MAEKSRIRIHHSFIPGEGSDLERAIEAAGVDPKDSAAMTQLLILGALAWGQGATLVRGKSGLGLALPGALNSTAVASPAADNIAMSEHGNDAVRPAPAAVAAASAIPASTNTRAGTVSRGPAEPAGRTSAPASSEAAGDKQKAGPAAAGQAPTAQPQSRPSNGPEKGVQPAPTRAATEPAGRSLTPGSGSADGSKQGASPPAAQPAAAAQNRQGGDAAAVGTQPGKGNHETRKQGQGQSGQQGQSNGNGKPGAIQGGRAEKGAGSTPPSLAKPVPAPSPAPVATVNVNVMDASPGTTPAGPEDSDGEVDPLTVDLKELRSTAINVDDVRLPAFDF